MDSREVYIQRINRVMDYVAKSIDQPIDLSSMAAVASFSPYHFHRIFTFVTGETPNNFVQRVRLEKSATMLHDNPRESIAEVALRCGFTNESAFSRAFKAYFGITATEFRKQEDAIYQDDPSVTSIEKVRQDASIVVAGDVKVDGEIGRAVIPGGKYAVGRFELRETEFEQAWNTMCKWLTESGWQPVDGVTYEYYYNDYKDHPDHKFIVDICIPVKIL